MSRYQEFAVNTQIIPQSQVIPDNIAYGIEKASSTLEAAALTEKHLKDQQDRTSIYGYLNSARSTIKDLADSLGNDPNFSLESYGVYKGTVDTIVNEKLKNSLSGAKLSQEQKNFIMMNASSFASRIGIPLHTKALKVVQREATNSLIKQVGITSNDIDGIIMTNDTDVDPNILSKLIDEKVSDTRQSIRDTYGVSEDDKNRLSDSLTFSVNKSLASRELQDLYVKEGKSSAATKLLDIARRHSSGFTDVQHSQMVQQLKSSLALMRQVSDSTQANISYLQRKAIFNAENNSHNLNSELEADQATPDHLRQEWNEKKDAAHMFGLAKNIVLNSKDYDEAINNTKDFFKNIDNQYAKQYKDRFGSFLESHFHERVIDPVPLVKDSEFFRDQLSAGRTETDALLETEKHWGISPSLMSRTEAFQQANFLENTLQSDAGQFFIEVNNVVGNDEYSSIRLNDITRAMHSNMVAPMIHFKNDFFPNLGQTLIRAYEADSSVSEQKLGKDRIDKIKSDIFASLQPLLQTYSLYADTGSGQLRGLINYSNKFAYQIFEERGEDGSKLLSNALQSKYFFPHSFFSSSLFGSGGRAGDIPYRIPKYIGNSAINTSLVNTIASNLVYYYRTSPNKLAIPKALEGLVDPVTNEVSRANVITSPDDRKLLLVDSYGSPLRTAKGKQISIDIEKTNEEGYVKNLYKYLGLDLSFSGFDEFLSSGLLGSER